MISTKHNALVVDDDDVARQMVAFALQREGFNGEHAVDGENALAILEKQIFELVVTDLKMPNTHGHALATELPTWSDRPIIVVHTSVLEPKLAKVFMARGVEDIVFKPTDYAALAAKSCSLVSGRKE